MRLQRHPARVWPLLALALLSLTLFPPWGPERAQAMEGGASHYIPGSYGDFLMGYIPEAGMYVRNDFLFQSTSLQGTAMGGKAYGQLNDQLFLSLTKLTWMFDAPGINGFVGLGLGIPLLVDEHVTGSLSIQDSGSLSQQSGGGRRGGLSDLYIMPAVFGWSLDAWHVLLASVIYLPTGYYNPDTLTSLGLNYLSFDENIAVTWLGKDGFELSCNAGYTFNTKNNATQYHSGNEFHLDWTVAYHLSDTLALGGVGYLYAQTTPDRGEGAQFGGYLSSSAGIGPALSYTFPMAGREVSLIAKWIHDTGGIHRLHGDLVSCSIAFKL